MLQGINRIGKSWVGRVGVAVMFGFLIISFAIWGIGDIFRGTTRTQVATVGKQEISADAFRTAYQSEYQNLIRRSRQTITPDQARALGLDTRVLGRLVTEAALDQTTRNLGLAVSDGLVVQSIQADPNFSGASGQFDRNRFGELLRDNGLSEPQYVRDQRAIVTRLQVAEAVTGALQVPLAFREAVHRFRNERRGVEFVSLGAAALGEIAPPTREQLQAFFDERKATYRAPEYRALNALAIDPTSLAKPDAITDAEARAYYERVKDVRFGTPERRSVQQVIFPAKADAEAAFARVKAGTAFDEIARERGIDQATLDLGTFTRAEMIDPAIGDAAFALENGAVSGPVDSRFGPALVRVTKIETATARPFEGVAPEVRGELAVERARSEILSLHDRIEDERAGAKPLADIARERGLTLLRLEAVDRSGLDKAGRPVGLTAAATVLPAAFKSDVGADNEAIRAADGGYVWFEVTKVEPGRDHTLDEVDTKVTADWRADEIARRLTERGRDLVARADKGEALSAIAGELGTGVETASDLARGAAAGALPADVVTRIFASPVGKAADAAAGDDRRVIFKVTSATVPPFVTTTQEAGSTDEQLRAAVSEDMIGEFIADIEKAIGVQVYPENMRRATGGEY